MKRQMIKGLAILTVASMLLVGCGSKEDNHDASASSTETETSVVESETSTQEETTSQETTEVVKNEEESETTPATEENTESAPKDELESEEEEPEQPVHKHDYTRVVTKEPSCRYLKEKGEAVFTCACGDSYTEKIGCVDCEGDGVRVTIQEPDCWNYGISGEHCKWCHRDMLTQEIPMTEHVPQDDYAKGGTCWVLYCRNCAAVLDMKSFDEYPERPERTLE